MSYESFQGNWMRLSTIGDKTQQTLQRFMSYFALPKSRPQEICICKQMMKIVIIFYLFEEACKFFKVSLSFSSKLSNKRTLYF